MSAEQFLFCFLIYKKKDPLHYKIVNERGPFSRKELKDLETRGYIINKNVGEDTYADMYELTPKFTKEIFGEQSLMWEELINTYPQFIFIDGKRIPAQSTDLDELKNIYFNKIGHSVKTHKKIVDLLIYASDHDLVNMGIEKWVKGEQWKAIEHLINEKPSKDALSEREF